MGFRPAGRGRAAAGLPLADEGVIGVRLPPNRFQLSAKTGRQRSLRFDWDRTAAATLALYRRLLS